MAAQKCYAHERINRIGGAFLSQEYPKKGILHPEHSLTALFALGGLRCRLIK